MSVSETWYVLTGTDPDSGKEIWTETEPDFSEDHEIRAGEIRAWNEKMKKLEEEGKARRFKKGLRIGGLFIKPKQKRQHAITISEDGEFYQVYINGNPRVSQAINELNGSKMEHTHYNANNTLYKQHDHQPESRNLCSPTAREI